MCTNNERQQKEEEDLCVDMNQDNQAEETSHEESSFEFDESKRYFPLFHLTDVPSGVSLFLRAGVLST